jgi:hypothetical protein
VTTIGMSGGSPRGGAPLMVSVHDIAGAGGATAEPRLAAPALSYRPGGVGERLGARPTTYAAALGLPRSARGPLPHEVRSV